LHRGAERLLTIPPDDNGAAAITVDMMDNASALPTCPQRQQQKTAIRKQFKIAHTTSRRGDNLIGPRPALRILAITALSLSWQDPAFSFQFR
jgi:hypothetical protein